MWLSVISHVNFIGQEMGMMLASTISICERGYWVLVKNLCTAVVMSPCAQRFFTSMKSRMYLVASPPMGKVAERGY